MGVHIVVRLGRKNKKKNDGHLSKEIKENENTNSKIRMD